VHEVPKRVGQFGIVHQNEALLGERNILAKQGESLGSIYHIMCKYILKACRDYVGRTNAMHARCRFFGDVFSMSRWQSKRATLKTPPFLLPDQTWMSRRDRSGMNRAHRPTLVRKDVNSAKGRGNVSAPGFSEWGQSLAGINPVKLLVGIDDIPEGL